ncbi:hypothetical protein Syun_000961 [Stephania yunnanensis]|uniref:V-type proton ATPase subunit E n=1 Tax=Stephania yunnanensis TaxID=152371 RepID=A0AAP0QAE8_9MAGN
MVRFIRQEVEEKANEINVSAEEEFQHREVAVGGSGDEKDQAGVREGREAGGSAKKIEYSMQLNASRIKVLQAQDDLVSSMKEAAAKELPHVSYDHHSYRRLLRDLIVQSLLRLKESAVLLRCQKEDLELVESFRIFVKD